LDDIILLIYFFQGDVIHGIIWKSMIDIFKAQIKESCIYTIKDFKVQQSTIYRPVDNELKIVFIYNTKVQEVMEASKIFQKFFFDFATTDMLLERESEDK
jgi:hypothetical protein